MQPLQRPLAHRHCNGKDARMAAALSVFGIVRQLHNANVRRDGPARDSDIPGNAQIKSASYVEHEALFMLPRHTALDLTMGCRMKIHFLHYTFLHSHLVFFF